MHSFSSSIIHLWGNRNATVCILSRSYVPHLPMPGLRRYSTTKRMVSNRQYQCELRCSLRKMGPADADCPYHPRRRVRRPLPSRVPLSRRSDLARQNQYCIGISVRASLRHLAQQCVQLSAWTTSEPRLDDWRSWPDLVLPYWIGRKSDGQITPATEPQDQRGQGSGR